MRLRSPLLAWQIASGKLCQAHPVDDSERNPTVVLERRLVQQRWNSRLRHITRPRQDNPTFESASFM
jgi:hypothetical protein